MSQEHMESSFNLYRFRGYWNPIYARFPLDVRPFQRLVIATDQERTIKLLTAADIAEYLALRNRTAFIHNTVDTAYLEWLEQLFFSENPEFLFIPVTDVVSYLKNDTFNVEFFVAGFGGSEEARNLMAIIAQAIMQNWPDCKFVIEEYRFQTVHDFLAHVDQQEFDPLIALQKKDTGYYWNSVESVEWQLASDISYDDEYDPDVDYEVERVPYHSGW